MKSSKSHWSRLLWVLALTLLLPLPASAGRPATSIVPIDSRVLEKMAADGAASYWVLLDEQADLSGAPLIKDWNARGQYVYDRLTSLADQSQAGLAAMLASSGAEYTRYWIVNAIQVHSGESVVRQVAAQAGVNRIVAPTTFQIPEPILGTLQGQTDSVEWNIARIRAPEVWSTYGATGQGIVVANIDTGVEFDHPALVTKYRGYLGGGAFDHNYNWFDPSGVCGNPSLVPCDNNGHGTHTMGTMVGGDGANNQIGVAPGARFITAKGCESYSCSDTALLASAQWILAPTDLSGANPRPDLRPHIVNNSWGDSGGDPWYRSMVQAWVAAGIFPVFSGGNSGPLCGSAGAPGDYPESYSAGAFDVGNVMGDFSGRGPSASLFGSVTKPNVAAPGVSVRSSYPEHIYEVLSGTSMAAPHVAGTVALLWSAAPALTGDIAATRAILDQSAVDTSDLQCGGTPELNNVWGEGRLDALAAVSQSPIGPAAVLQGTVTDYNDGLGISGAAVTVLQAGSTVKQMATGLAGFYRVYLPLGVYDIEVSAPGYQTGTAHFTLDEVGANCIEDLILATARAEVSPATLTFLVPPGASRNQTLVLANTGSLPMSWQIVEQSGASTAAGAAAIGSIHAGSGSYESILADVAWLSTEPPSGTVPAGGQQIIQVATDAANAELGSQQASIIVQTSSGRQPNLTVPVRLVVSEIHRQFLPVIQAIISTGR